MKRDKQWLKVEARKHFDEWWSSSMSLGKLIDGTLELIDQLDEQGITQKQAWEVLAPRFSMTAEDLERQVLDGFLAMTAEEIEMESDKIRKLADGIKKLHAENEELKAKLDEPEKVVVPQFVADYIDRSREEGYSLYGAFNEMSTEVADWLIDSKSEGKSEGQDTFARAWLDGYEIEKEPLYYVQLLEGESYLCEEPFGALWFNNTGLLLESSYKGKMRFTEKETKDYDERFWAFAVSVEENK